jgi:hypothetical protein
MCCSGCEYESENIESRAERGFIKYVDFSYDVVADEDTHIIYIYHNGSANNAVLCPYYSKNGKLCRYEDGKRIEVNADEDSD